MTFHDVLCQWNKETEIVIKCRKLSWHVVNCRDCCRKLSWHFCSRPLPAVPFWFSPIYVPFSCLNNYLPQQDFREAMLRTPHLTSVRDKGAFKKQTITVELEIQNHLQWGRSNLVDPAEWPKIGLLNRDFGSILSVFLGKTANTQSSLNFLQSGPPKFTKSDFSGLAPIRRVLRNYYLNNSKRALSWNFLR